MALNNLYQLDEGLGEWSDPPRAPAKKKTTKRIVRRVSMPRRSTSSNQTQSQSAPTDNSIVFAGAKVHWNAEATQQNTLYDLRPVVYASDRIRPLLPNLKKAIENSGGFTDVRVDASGAMTKHIIVEAVTLNDHARKEDIRDWLAGIAYSAGLNINTAVSDVWVTKQGTRYQNGNQGGATPQENPGAKNNSNNGSLGAALGFGGDHSNDKSGLPSLFDLFGGGGITIGLLAALAVVVVIAKK